MSQSKKNLQKQRWKDRKTDGQTIIHSTLLVRVWGLLSDDKLQYNINRAAAKIPALSSGKAEKYEYLIDEKRLPPQ